MSFAYFLEMYINIIKIAVSNILHIKEISNNKWKTSFSGEQLDMGLLS